MKTYVAAVLISVIANVANAQQTTTTIPTTIRPLPKHWILGIETDNLALIRKTNGPGDDFFERKLMPTIGYTVATNLVVGIGIPVGLVSRKGTYYGDGTNGQTGIYTSQITLTQIGISPFIQQFIGQGKLKPFVGASYRYSYQRLDYSIRELSVYLDQTGHEAEVSIFTGLTYFITPRIGIDAKLRYGWQRGNHPNIRFPNKPETTTYAYTGQTASANVGLRLLIGK